MSADKRTVSTDALETLGTLIGPNEKRDAIHLAVLPIEAGYHLKPGEHVRIGEDGRAIWGFNEEAIGIVDPFLKQPVKEGQRFWLVIYPRVITSLRHVWTHPRIADDLAAGVTKARKVNTVEELQRLESKDWLTAYAVALFSYHGVEYDDEGERKNSTAQSRAEACFQYLIENVESGFFGTDIEYGESLAPSDELWMHFERYMGRKATNRPEYFRCAC